MSKERYVNLSDRQVKDTQNQSQDFMSINTICRRLNQQDKTIADLEAKLAEKESWYYAQLCENEDLERQLAEHNEYFNLFACKDFDEFKDFISTFMLTPHEEQTLIQELKQQLAEKEKLIKEFSEFIFEAQKGSEFLLKQDNINLREQLEQADQDKISFCIEKLEKVKANILSNITFGIESVGIMNSIDNQIEELKKEE